MYKIGIIGDKNSVLGFKAVGLSVFICETPDEARKALSQAACDDYAIIYIVESIAQKIGDTIEKFSEVRIPAVIPIPGMDGITGIGMANVKKSVEKAIGADIIFGNS